MAKPKAKSKTKVSTGPKKKRNRRSQIKYPSLDPKYNLKSRFDEINDIASYAKNLPEDAKAWLASFTEEYVNANFKHPGKKIIKNTKVNRSQIYARNNARNRDSYTQAQAQGKTLFIEDVFNDEEELNEKLKEMHGFHDEGDDSY